MTADDRESLKVSWLDYGKAVNGTPERLARAAANFLYAYIGMWEDAD